MFRFDITLLIFMKPSSCFLWNLWKKNLLKQNFTFHKGYEQAWKLTNFWSWQLYLFFYLFTANLQNTFWHTLENKTSGNRYQQQSCVMAECCLDKIDNYVH